MKCPVCDQLNTSMLCPQCGFDASRDYEKYPTFGIVRNVPAISARQAEQDIGRRTTKQLLDRVAELEHQMHSMTETNRLLLEKLSHLERAVRASNGQKPNRLRQDSIRDVSSFRDANVCPVFGSKLRRDQIASVTFLDTLADAPQDAWDVSADKSGSVMAWIIPRGKLYALFLAADGEIKAPESCEKLFAGYRNMRRIHFGNCFDTSRVKNMRSMFDNCSSLTKLDLSSFDTSRVQNMRGMFCICSSLTELDLSSFDTSRVQDMRGMFGNCSSLTELDLSSFDTSRVQDMRWMFSGCSSLTELDLRSFKTSNVQNMASMFDNCSSLAKLDLTNFDTSNVIYMHKMFYGCSSLTTLDLRNFDTSNVTSMGCMFKDCNSLTTLKRSRLLVTTNAKRMACLMAVPQAKKSGAFCDKPKAAGFPAAFFRLPVAIRTWMCYDRKNAGKERKPHEMPRL